MFQILIETHLKFHWVNSPFFKVIGITVIMAVTYREVRVGIISYILNTSFQFVNKCLNLEKKREL